MTLAMVLHQPNVDVMLDHRRGGLTAKQFMEWQYFAEICPFPFVRADYNSANIAKALWDIARDRKKHPNAFDQKDFVIRYGMDAEPKKTQTSKQHFEIFKSMIASLGLKPKGRVPS